MYPYKIFILGAITKDYNELDKFDINNFEKILYNVYSSHKNLFKDNAINILLDIYKNNKSYEEISNKYKISIREVQENLAATFKVLKTDEIREKFLLPKRTEIKPLEINTKNGTIVAGNIIDEYLIEENIPIEKLNTSNKIIKFLKTNKIKTINELLTYNYSTLENLPNITNKLFTEIIITTRKWIIKNNYNIKDWPR